MILWNHGSGYLGGFSQRTADKADTKSQQLPTSCVFQPTTLGLKYQGILRSSYLKSCCLTRALKSKLMFPKTQSIPHAAAFVRPMSSIAKPFCCPYKPTWTCLPPAWTNIRPVSAWCSHLRENSRDVSAQLLQRDLLSIANEKEADELNTYT